MSVIDDLPTEESEERGEVELIYKLSPMQQAMLFHSLYAPDSGVYVIQLSLRLSGRLDVAAFERAWRYIVAQHGILRTAFFWENQEKPRQVVFRRVSLKMARESWRGLDAGEQQARLRRYLDADREQGFELGTAPLMRLALFELAAEEHQLVWTLHHLLVDGWSQGILFKDLFTSYTALAGGGGPALGRVRSYREYIAWLQRQDLEEAEAFWRQNLAGFSRPTYLAAPQAETTRETAPTDYRGSQRREVRLPPATTAALREVARRHGLTLNTLVQGAWALLLAGSTAEPDVVFGSTVAGRPTELTGVESIVGPFINTLPVRVQAAPDRRLMAWLAELQEQQAEVRHYEYAPLVEMQRWSELPAGVALFDHILIFENYPLDEALSGLLPGLAISGLAVNELTNYPLNLMVSPGAELLLSLLHDVGRFEATAAGRLLDRLTFLLATFAAGADVRLSELPTLPAAERHQLIAEYNDTAVGATAEICLHHWIERQAELSPESVAVTSEGSALSYGELAARARRLSHHLRGLGVGPDVVVGICGERSVGLLVGLLGILKAGGAYLPLDPSYPPERLVLMVEDALVGAGPPVLLVEERFSPLFAGWSSAAGARRVELQGPWDATRPADGAEGGAQPDNLAYVLYTSGSTGRPKGVQIPHRAVVNFLAAMGRRPGMASTDTLLAVTTLSFDIAGLELYLPLVSGARVELVPREVAQSGDQLLERLVRSGTTIMQATPATWRLLLGAGFKGDGSLKVLCGGEALPLELAEEILGAAGALWNVYGPTETTIWSMLHEVRRGERISIGRPLENTQVHLLSPLFTPVPLGAPGELYIGGSGLARGYRGRPDLTAERFLPDPFSVLPGARLYRTGDLARQAPDGTVEFLGRTDDQVKLRGFRIEPGEISAVLGRHPEVREAIVVAREERPGDVRLVAYVVPAREPGPEVADLRSWLAARLPDFMVPRAFVELPALPLTPSGKVDRRALPAPAETRREEAGDGALRGPIEEMVAGIWEEVLGLERLGPADDFFALGGHSLLAMQVISRARGAFELDLPVRRLFEAPTVAGFARAVEAARRGDAVAAAPPIQPVSPHLELPLSFSQERLWFLDQLEPGNAAYNMPAAFRLHGKLHLTAFAASLGEVVRRQGSLRTLFHEGREGPVQGVYPVGPVELPQVDLKALPAVVREGEVLRLTAEEAYGPFDLARGPLWRAVLLAIEEKTYGLLVTLHHIVSDGWSMGVLVREVATLYRSLLAGQPSPLPELPIQYADFAVWQRQWLTSDTMQAGLDYWRQQLSGVPPLALPTDRPRPLRQTFAGAQVPIDLGGALSSSLGRLARQQAVTPFMVFLATFEALLRSYSGQDDFGVGTFVANRTRPEIEGLIGFFVNNLALRAHLTADLSFLELLGRGRETALGAFAHQDLPFEKILEELRPDRNASHPPLFQVMLVLLNLPQEEFALPSLTLTSLPRETRRSNFDLTLWLTEGREGFAGTLDFNRDLFDGTTLVRLRGHFMALLAGAVESPDRPLLDLPLLGGEERWQVLGEWSLGPVAEPPRQTVYELFAAVAASTPEAVAVVSGERHLTYGELGRAASRLAERLTSLGVGRESAVGLALARSPEMLVGLLGIFAAGGFYVPLDLSYPAERLALLLADSAARALVSERRLAASLPMGEFVPVLVDEPLAGLARSARREREELQEGGGLRHLAYTIYTSGSTGRPKGVLVEHGSLAHHTLDAATFFALRAADRVLQFAALSFDTSAEEIWPCLTRGATLVLRSDEMIGSPREFLERCAELEITVLDLPTAYWHEIAAALEGGGASLPPSLRLVIIGGERARPERWEAWRRQVGSAIRLVNTYGPTEATVVSTRNELHREPALSPGREVSIGRAIPGSQAYVLAADLTPQPVGISGELCLGGAGLARGYLHRPDLTAERFVPDPFAATPGSRLYRSGDLARYLTSGRLEFVGRIDQQVKVRGFRVEPGEVEAALAAHPAVETAVVTAREDLPGGRGLVGYLVPRRGLDLALPALREFLRQRLPEHMIPVAFVALAELPVNASGKVDRRALPAPERGPAEGVGFVPPETEVEERLAALWADLLKLERVGAFDNFFELGGHSLLATRLVTSIRLALDVEVPLRSLFEAPTLAEMALLIEELLIAKIEDLSEAELSRLS